MQQRNSTAEEYHQRVNIVVEYIHNHLGENIDLTMLAEKSHFSPFHFHRIMKAFLGEPIWAFIVRTRIETAARLLRYTDMSIESIAYQIGYSAPSSLSKAFRQLYGISPNEYRNNIEYMIMKPTDIRTDLDITIKVEERPSKQLMYIRLTGEYASLDYCGTWEKLFQYAAELQIPCNEMEHIAIYPDDPKVTEPSKLRSELCLSVPHPVPAKGEIGSKELPGGKYAVFRYKGPYTNLGAVYDTIYGHWMLQGEYILRHAYAYEIYLNNPVDTAPEDLLTEICVPVQ
ncbi:MAG: AraC family transcriptional regulator [Bacteroides sp.]|nr:AraC family transcriptional regulator [Bacteroides sp.]